MINCIVQWQDRLLLSDSLSVTVHYGPANRKFPLESNLESNQGVVVYMFNADCLVGVVYVL